MLTLRDARRLVHRMPVVWVEHRALAVRGNELDVWLPESIGRSGEASSVLDRAISILGADWYPDTSKETSEAAEGEQTSQEVHGGNHAAAECKPRNESGSGKEGASCDTDSSDGETLAGDSEAAGSEQMSDSTGGDTSGEQSADSGQSSQGGNPAKPSQGADRCPEADLGTKGNGQESSTSHSTIRVRAQVPMLTDKPESDISGAGSSCGVDPQNDLLIAELEARRSLERCRERRRWLRKRALRLQANPGDSTAMYLLYQSSLRDEIRDLLDAVTEETNRANDRVAMAARPSLCAKATFGGDHFERRKLRGEFLRQSIEIRQLLQRLIDVEMATYGDPVPRLDGRKLIRELISKSMRLPRCKREQHEPKLAVLAVDVSGSCSSYCQTLGEAMLAVAERDPRVLVVLHSNGHPLSWFGPVAGLPQFREGTGASLVWWQRLLQVVQVGLVVALGDNDADEQLRLISEEAKLVFLHNYCASYPVQWGSKSLIRSYAKTARVVQGVGGAADTIAALKLLKKEQNDFRNKWYGWLEHPTRN